MDEMKGVGRILMSCQHDTKGLLHLLSFGDGSLSVRINGRAISVWEPFDTEEAVCSFLDLIEFGRPHAPGAAPNVVIFRSAWCEAAASTN